MDTPPRHFAAIADDGAILAIVEAFRARTLPFADWSHQAHLATGLWHVATHGEQAARGLLRDGIRAYNVAVGRVNDETRGYHETVTHYFVWSAARFLERTDETSLARRVDAYVESPFGAKDGIFLFWSRERLLSPGARLSWADPDIRPLDADVLVSSYRPPEPPR